ncbi:MAG: hypothetical protein PHX78_00205 [bacterium]|nr:hypothetical protein [bacterium]
MADLISNFNPFILFLVGLVSGYLIKLFLPEKFCHKNINKINEVFDSYYRDLKTKSVKELTAREYQHLSLMKKIEFEKKYPQKADSKIALPLSKVFTIHSVFPNVYSKPNKKLAKIFSFIIIVSVIFFGGIFVINSRGGF